MLDTRESYAAYGGRNRLLATPPRICELTPASDSRVRLGWEYVWLSTQWPCCLSVETMLGYFSASWSTRKNAARILRDFR